MSPTTHHRLAHVIVNAAARVVPPHQRDGWRKEWHGELASLHRLPIAMRRPMRRALGAFADAFWLRQRSVADFVWIDDVRIGLRQLLQHSGFAVSAIGILSLGLAATITMFSVTDQVLLRPLPYPDADRVMGIGRGSAGDRQSASHRDVAFLREQVRTCAPIAAITGGPGLNVLINGRSSYQDDRLVSHQYFEVIGVQPQWGRGFTAEEDAPKPAPVVVLNERFVRRMNLEPAALVGSDIQTNPPATNEAVQSSGRTFTRTIDELPPLEVLSEIAAKVDGVHMEQTLMEEGLRKFADPQKALLALIESKR